MSEPMSEIAPANGNALHVGPVDAPRTSAEDMDVEAACVVEARANLSSLGHTSDGKGRWTSRALLLMMQFMNCLRPSASMAEALSLAVRLLLGVRGQQFADDVRAGRVELPSRKVFLTASLRLDMMDMLYQRTLIKDNFLAFYNG